MQLPVSFPDPFVGPPMFFLKYKKKRKKGRVKLCGIKKKNIWYIFNLHKLPVKVRKTGEDKCRNICKGDSFAKQFLFPAKKIFSDDGMNTAFINGRAAVHNRFMGLMLFVIMNNGNMIFQGNLGIRNHGR